ncbi:MAG: hypothetical protein H0V46_08055 [Sphingomonas sp.]|nr:hypothetical protein [Sphingomonas sp.]
MHYLRTGSLRLLLGVIAVAAVTTTAQAGEITGNGKSLKNPDGTLNGNSLCAFSGRNDSPNGLVLPIGPGGALVTIDPGGDVQSFGYFYAQKDFGGDPSDPDTRSGFAFPGVGCNPSTNSGGH